jgi:hemerythrin-like domain-containing protein
MGIQIGARPDSGFDDPIGMLMDCHRRIERFLHILCVVADRGQGRALADEETVAVKAALQYFREGGKRHNADEEESLFPRLRGEAATAQEQELTRLENDHRSADHLHSEVEDLYSAWIAAGRLNPDDEARLRSAAEQLKRLYEEHIRVEEKTVFPYAVETLDPRAIAAIGLEFRARRA